MAHEVENMFSVNETPWHGLGRILTNAPTVEDAIVTAGLDWEVRLQPLHMKFDGEEMPVPGYATVRTTDKRVLGVVGPTYKPVQNKDAFSWFQPWLDAGEAALETAGSLRHGKRVWVLARIKRDPIEIVPGDAIRSYVLLSNGHDGTLALRTGFSGIRVVCANTMAAAHGDKASKLLRIRHSKNALAALEHVREVMNLADREFVANADAFKTLARKGVSVEDLKSYVRKVFAPKVMLNDGTEEETNERLIGKIIPLFENGRGNNLPGVRGTMWAAYNSVNEYLAYERGRDDVRLDSMWFGDGARVNQKALQVALAMVA